MNLRHTPYAQIALVCLRGLNLQDSRWLYFTLISVAVITIAGGGIVLEWGVTTLLTAAIGASVLGLQIVWVGIAAVLLRLNHPTVSRLVPGYVTALRRAALAIWLGICLLTGLAGILDGTSVGWFVFEVCMAGALMLLIGTPMRWPVRWCLAVAALMWLGRHSGAAFEWEPLQSVLTTGQGQLTLAALVFIAMAWVVTRMIASKGNGYASVFSRFMGMQESEHGANEIKVLMSSHFSPWLKAYFTAAHWVTLPWRRYASHLLSNPKPEAANAIARAELGFGPAVHWVTQLSFSLGFAALLALVWWVYPELILGGGAHTSPLVAFYIALASAMCSATSVLSIGSVMLLQQGEQKLMLLLPGVPQSSALNRHLARRHVRMAVSAWFLGTAWALVLPYPDGVANYVAAFCWSTLPLVQFVVQDWATVRPPQAGRSILTLGLVVLLPVSAWAALQWLHLPMELLAGIAVTACLLMLRIRWTRLAHFAQAWPVGRLA